MKPNWEKTGGSGTQHPGTVGKPKKVNIQAIGVPKEETKGKRTENIFLK